MAGGGGPSPRAPENHTKAEGAQSDAASGMGMTEVTGDGMRQRGWTLSVPGSCSHVVPSARIWAAPGAVLRSVPTGSGITGSLHYGPRAWSQGISPLPQPTTRPALSS